MASQVKPLPLSRTHDSPEYGSPTGSNDMQLAPVDRVVACLDRAIDVQGEYPPDPDALLKARTLLSAVSFWAGGSIPDPVAIFEIDGGVQIAWKNNDLHLRLFCAPVASKSYIYKGRTINGRTASSAIMKSVDVFTLADGLRWLHER
jgi:hypothetical protein